MPRPKNFRHRKRHTAPDGPGPGRPSKPPTEPAQHRASASELAGRLWVTSYTERIRLEAAEQPELLTLIEEAVLQHSSSYAQRGCGGPAAREKHGQAVALAAMQASAQVQRLGNQLKMPLLIVARSLSWLMSMARKKQWQEEQKMRRLLDRSTAVKVTATALALTLALTLTD